MDAKHRTAQLLGVVAIIVGCLVGLLLIRRVAVGHIANIWIALSDLFVASFAAYLISVGVRGLRYSISGERDASPRFKWGRILAGSWLIFSEIKNYYHPAPNLLKASNQGEAVGMGIMFVVLVLIGGWLVITGIRARFVLRQLNAQ
jgi:hypothetical protein